MRLWFHSHNPPCQNLNPTQNPNQPTRVSGGLQIPDQDSGRNRTRARDTKNHQVIAGCPNITNLAIAMVNVQSLIEDGDICRRRSNKKDHMGRYIRLFDIQWHDKGISINDRRLNN